jgi:hypothetical protein
MAIRTAWCLISKALNAYGASKRAVEESHTCARADTKNGFLYAAV